MFASLIDVREDKRINLAKLFWPYFEVFKRDESFGCEFQREMSSWDKGVDILNKTFGKNIHSKFEEGKEQLKGEEAS